MGTGEGVSFSLHPLVPVSHRSITPHRPVRWWRSPAAATHHFPPLHRCCTIYLSTMTPRHPPPGDTAHTGAVATCSVAIHSRTSQHNAVVHVVLRASSLLTMVLCCHTRSPTTLQTWPRPLL